MRILILFLICIMPVASYGLKLERFSFTDANFLNPGLRNEYNPSLGTIEASDTDSNIILLQGYSLGLKPLNKVNWVSSLATDASDDDVVARVEGPPLVFPNPFKLSDGAILQYKLSKNMNIEIIVYDSQARELFRTKMIEGMDGALKGYNDISISASRFSIPLSSGVYLFFILSDGDVKAKGKFVVRAG